MPCPAPVVTPSAPAPCAGAPAFEPLPFPEVPDLSLVTLVPSQTGGQPPRRAHLFFYEASNTQLNGHAPFLADLPILVELWSSEPNDFDGAAFSLAQGAMEPSVTEEEWVQHLAKRDEDLAREAKEREERQAREAKERQERAQREAEEFNRRALERQRFCAAHPQDRECRPPEPVRVVERRREPRPVVVAAAPPRALEPVAPPAPQPRPAPGPPPVPPVEQVPEQPAPYVSWVHGYWRWSGFEWAWMPGWWRIDEAAARAAAQRATVACPLPRAEQPPSAPVADAVWRPGVWIWNFAQWVWVPGTWHAAVPVR